MLAGSSTALVALLATCAADRATRAMVSDTGEASDYFCRLGYWRQISNVVCAKPVTFMVFPGYRALTADDESFFINPVLIFGLFG